MWEGIAGYAIDGARGARDRMAERPDRIGERELRGALRPGFPWGDIVTLAATFSANRVVMEMAENGAPHGTVVVPDAAFVSTVLDNVLRWSFAPTGGSAEDVINPFVFLLPK